MEIDVTEWVSEEQQHIANATVDVSQFMTGVAPGSAVADAEVCTPEGEGVRLSALWAERPALVVTGSLTCPPSRLLNPATAALANEYAERLNVAVLYVIDAHPKGDRCPYTGTDWVTETNEDEGILIRQPRDQQERNGRAAEYRQLLGLPQVLVDNMDNGAWAALGKAPNTAVVIGTDGRCLACQDWFRPDELRQALADLPIG